MTSSPVPGPDTGLGGIAGQRLGRRHVALLLPCCGSGLKKGCLRVFGIRMRGNQLQEQADRSRSRRWRGSLNLVHEDPAIPQRTTGF